MNDIECIIEDPSVESIVDGEGNIETTISDMITVQFSDDIKIAICQSKLKTSAPTSTSGSMGQSNTAVVYIPNDTQIIACYHLGNTQTEISTDLPENTGWYNNNITYPLTTSDDVEKTTSYTKTVYSNYTRISKKRSVQYSWEGQRGTYLKLKDTYTLIVIYRQLST